MNTKLIAYRRFLTGNDENEKAYKFINAAAKLTNDPEIKKDAELVFRQVCHLYSPNIYKKYYSEDLTEYQVAEESIFNDWDFPERMRWVTKRLKDQQAKTILDVGCCDGPYSLNLAKKGYKVTGINLYKPSIELANERAKKFELDAKFIQADAIEFEPKEKFDAILLFEIIEHIPNPKSFIDKYMKMLSKNGVLYISTPNGCYDLPASSLRPDAPDIRGHVRVYTEKIIRETLKEYKIEEVYVSQDGLLHVAVKNET